MVLGAEDTEMDNIQSSFSGAPNTIWNVQYSGKAHYLYKDVSLHKGLMCTK